MTKTKRYVIRSFEAFMYVEVRTITEMKNGKVFKTEPKGYANKNRPIQENEAYCPISTSLLRSPTFEVDLLI